LTHDWSVHHAELIAINLAIDIAVQEQVQKWSAGYRHPQTYTILSDSRSALQALDNPTKKSGQSIVNQILQSAMQAKAQCAISLRVQWIPSHSGILGNEIADHLAKEAVNLPVTHDFHKPVSLRRAYNRALALKHWKSEWAIAGKGGFLRSIDSALPGRHVRHLYDSRRKKQSYFLMQLRSGHCWLATHGKKMRKREDDKCECGARESVKHVLMDCPKLRSARQKLREKIGPRFNSISLMLGGKPGKVRDGLGKWRITTKELEAVLEFAEETQRFISRVPREEGSQHTTADPPSGW
jgi:ribonuclease HI